MSAESITVATPPTTQQPTTEDVVFQPSTTVDPTQPLRRFAFKCANVFLTYSRCNLTPQEAGEHLWDLARPWTPAYICVSAELHQDGTPHLHALLQSIRPITTRDPLFFDMQMYHPNIKAARSSNRTRDYILKNPISTFERGTFIPRGGMDPGSSAGNTRPATRDQRMKEIMNSSTTKSEYLSAIQTAFPFEWATKLHHFEYSAERLFPTAASPFIPPSIPSPPDLMCHERIEEWQSENLFQGDASARQHRPRSLYIVGPTRTGKTTWARSIEPLRHNYWQFTIDFLRYNNEARYNVLDDIPFKFCPCWKQLVGGQKDYTVNPKYARKTQIKGGIPSIILVNYDEDWLKVMTPAQLDYFYDNCVVYQMELHEKFYTPS
ncbi:replication-associated protein [Maize streak dwarfing virus]|uniref:Replication-associated protein n=1 Tax=Maize streak dwarfing virus TaxID=2557970 RepID=A0A482G269_9GEMI|nr:replication-associated protein [Maize streak dwarfing virus]QBO56213.1 replication-associated protein [Maize streak dwarfing virus]